MENPTDDQDIAVASADQDVPRAVDISTGRVSAALRQTPGEHPVTKL